MKKLLILTIWSAAIIPMASAQCEIPLEIVNAPSGNTVPAAAQKMLNTRLTAAALSSGEVKENSNSPFFLMARFDNLNKGVLPGPPMQHTVTAELTFMMGQDSSIGEASSRHVFSSETITLRGVGNSEEKALVNALQRINGKNKDLRNLIAEGREKIIEYYDRNTPLLLDRADKAASLGNYDEALSYVVQIPECSSGYPSARSATGKYYKMYADRTGHQLVKQARTMWAADPTPAQVTEILSCLQSIPVGSEAEKEAEILYKEMEAALKDDRKFEHRQKYADALDLEKRSLDAARQVGTAYGHGPKPNSSIIIK